MDPSSPFHPTNPASPLNPINPLYLFRDTSTTCAETCEVPADSVRMHTEKMDAGEVIAIALFIALCVTLVLIVCTRPPV